MVFQSFLIIQRILNVFSANKTHRSSQAEIQQQQQQFTACETELPVWKHVTYQKLKIISPEFLCIPKGSFGLRCFCVNDKMIIRQYFHFDTNLFTGKADSLRQLQDQIIHKSKGLEGLDNKLKDILSKLQKKGMDLSTCRG